MKTFRIAAISFVSIILTGSQVALQAAPKAIPGEGSVCSANGKTGTIVIESGNGHAWCKVGDRETECGGTPDRCSYGKVVNPRFDSKFEVTPQFNNSTPIKK